MPKVIRHSVFETNSSSTHSISIGTYKKERGLDGIFCLVKQGEFGRWYSRHNDFETKLQYLYTDRNGTLPEGLKELLEEKLNLDIYLDEKFDGYIDHESVGTSRGFGETNEEIFNFLTNKNAWLFIAEDNSLPPINFYVVKELPFFVSLETCDGNHQYDPNKDELFHILEILFEESDLNENYPRYSFENPKWALSKLNKLNKMIRIVRESWNRDTGPKLLEEKWLKYTIRKNPNYKKE